MHISTAKSPSFLKSLLIISITLFAFVVSSVDSFAQSCGPFAIGTITGGVTQVANGDGCANSAVIPGVLRIAPGNVDDASNPNNFAVYIDWDDGTNQIVNYPSLGMTYSAATHAYSVDVPHLFPKSGATVKCSYFPKTFLRIAGVTCGSQFGIAPEFIRWNTDDQISGKLDLSETVSSLNTYLVCAGQTASVTFSDRSTLNCVPPQFTDLPNKFEQRWRRFDYGTGATNIVGMLVGGVAQPNGFQGAVISDAPTYTAVPTPVATLVLKVPNTAVVNQIYEITMNYWNYCNPYPGTPVTFKAYIKIIAQPPALIPAAAKEICYGASNATNFTVSGNAGSTAINWYNKNPVTDPTAVLVPNPAGANSVNFSGSNYKSPALGGTGSGFNTSLAAGAGAVYSLWATQVFGLVNTCESPPVEVVIRVKPQLTAPASPTGTTTLCNGTTGVVYTAAANPTPSIAAGSFTNVAAVNYTTQYVWSASPATGITFSGATATTNTAAFNIAPEPNPFNNVNIQVLRQYSDGSCSTGNGSIAVHVDGKSSISTITAGGTVCSGSNTGNITASGIIGTIQNWEVDPGTGTFGVDGSLGAVTTINPVVTTGATTTIYKYRAAVKNGSCAPAYSPVSSVTVNPIPSQPVITPSGPTTFCAGLSVTLSSSNTLAASYQWFKDGTLLAGQTAQTIILNAAAQSGDYTVQTFGVLPTKCPSNLSSPVTVLVNPLPTVANPTGGGAVCGGNPAPDINWVLTGTPPFNITYTANGVPVVDTEPTLNYTITTPLTAPAVTTTYQMTNVTDANGCSATALGGTAKITIGGTAPTFVSGPTITPTSVCINGAATTDPTLNFTLDAASASLSGFILTYKIDGVTKPTKSFNTNAASAPTAAITFTDVELNNATPSPHVIKIVNIISPATCQTIFNIDLNFTVNPLPAIPTGAVPAFACSSPGTGVPLNVNDPGGVNLEIAWSTAGPAAAAFVAVTPANGAVSGVNNKTFTPATSATFTYYAFTRNTLTGCVSATGLSVKQTQDLLPAAAVAGPNQPNLCGTTATLAATPATNGGIGTWTVVSGGPATFTTPTSATTGVTGLTLNPPGGAIQNIVLRWTVRSANNVCSPTQSDVTLTTNPLPTAVNITPQLCDDVAGAPLQVASVDLTTYNTAVTNAPTVQWYTSPARTAAFLITGNVSVLNGQVFYYTATLAAPALCVNTGTATFTVNALPSAVDKTFQFCENAPGFGSATGINLTSFEMGAAGVTAGGTAATRDVEWYEDNGSGGLGALITTETNYTLPAPVTASPRVVHAKVIDLGSGVTPKCFDIADVTLIYKKKPNDNPVTGPNTVCTGTAIQIYQVDPALNSYTNPGIATPVHTYTWAVTGTAGFSIIAGGGTNSANFFILVKFNGAPGNIHFDVTETVDGCSGITNGMDVVVSGAPPALVFDTPATQVCKGQTSTYTVTSTNNSIFTWNVVGGAIVGANSGPKLTTITVNWGSVSLPQPSVSVTETSSQGCPGSPASVNVFLNDVPSMTSSATASTCSNVAPTLAFTSTIPSTYSWKVTSITGAITGTSVGNAGSGNLGTTFTGAAALVNTSGAVGSVSFDVVPTAIAAPNCQGVAQSVVLSVNPQPFLVNAQTKTICSGALVNYEILLSPLNLPTGTVFNWPKPVMSDGSNQGSIGSNVASGSGGTIHITDVLTNTSATSITATYTITPSSGFGCLGTPKDVVITINPQPTLSSTLDAVRCSQTSIGLTFATAPGSVAASNYNVISKSIPGGLTPAGTNAAVPATGVSINYLANDSYTNLSATVLNVSYTILPVSGSGCSGSPLIVTIGINPEPVLNTGLDASVCSDVPSGIILSTKGTSIGASGYNIVGRTIAVGLVGAGTNAPLAGANGVAANYLANDKFTNTTAGNLTVIYQVVPVSPLGCLGSPPVPVTLTVLPEPVVSTSLNTAACSGKAVGLTLNTNGTSIAAASYDVTIRSVDAGLTASGSNALVPSVGPVSTSYLTNDSYTNVGSAPLNVKYTIVPRSAAGCVGDAFVVTVVINPEPVMSPALNKVVCSDLATGVLLNTNGTSVGAANYNITARTISPGLTPVVANVAVPATGVAANYLLNDVFTNVGALPLTVTYTVVPVSSTGCLGTPLVITVTVNPEPVMSPLLDATVCSEVKTGLILNTNGSSVAAANYNIVGVLIDAGLTAGGGNAVVPFSGVAADYLKNDTYFNTSGSTAKLVKYTVVPVSATGSCAGDLRVITITISPEPVLATNLDAISCSGLATGLTLNTNGSSVGASNYSVTAIVPDAGLVAAGTNAVIANNVAANYLANDKFTNTGALPLAVRYTVAPNSASGCPGPSGVVTITINPEPVLSGTLDASFCSDVVTGLTLATNGLSVGAAKYNITARTIGSGSLIPAATNVTVPASGVAADYLSFDAFTNNTASPINVTYTVVPVSAAGCVGLPKIVTIIINPEPVVSTTLNNTICSQSPIALTLATNGVSVAAATYNITAHVVPGGLTPGGSNVAVPAIGVTSSYLTNDVYKNTGAVQLSVTYTVVPVSASGCTGDPKLITMIINPEPVVATTLDKTVCSDAAIALTLNTNGTSVAATSYNITGRVAQAGLTGAVGNVAIPANGVAAGFVAADKFTNVTTAPLIVTYTVVPVAANGCKGVPKDVIVTINPEPVLTSTLSTTICSDIATGITLTTNPSAVAAQNYNITSISIAAGLTANAANGAIPATGVNASFIASDKFTNPTSGQLTVTYNIIPVSASGCLGDPVAVVVTVTPEPVIPNLNATVCSDDIINLTLNTNGTSVVAGSYNVMSIVADAGLTAAGTNKPIANGVAATYLLNDAFNNKTSGPLDVNYTVIPVSGAGCLGDPKLITITINPEPVVSTTLDAAACSDVATGLVLNTNGTSVVATKYNITARVIDPALTAAGSNVAVPSSPGVAANYLATDKFTNTGTVSKTVTYTVVPVSGSGCSGDPKVITITINPEPVVSTTLDANVCSDDIINLTLSTTGSVAAANYNIISSTVATGLTANAANAAIPAPAVAAAYLKNDKYTNLTSTLLTVQYVVVPVSAGGCLGDQKTITMTINPEPVLSTTLNGNACSGVATGLTLNTNGTSVAANSYNLTLINITAGLVPAGSNALVGNGKSAASLASDKFTNTSNVNKTVTYTIVPVSLGGCLGDPVLVVITINPEPVVSTTLDKAVCSNLPTALVLNTNGTSIAAANYNLTLITVAPGLVPVVGNVSAANGVAANYMAADKFTNTTAGNLTVVYAVTPVSAGGCKGVSKNVTVTINPQPVLSTALDKSVCSNAVSGIALTTVPTSVAAANFNITNVTVPAGLTVVTTAVIPAVGVAANYLANNKYSNVGNASLDVLYTVVPVSAGGCLGDPVIVKQTVNPEPVLSSLNKTVCSKDAIALTLTTVATSVAASTYNITGVTFPGLTAVAGNAPFPATGKNASYLLNDKYINTGLLPLTANYTVVPVSAGSCPGTAVTVVVTINPEPVLSSTLNAAVCSQSPSGITLSTKATSVVAANYNISSIVIGGGLIPKAGNSVVANGVAANAIANDSFTNTGASPLIVTYTIIPVSAAGCQGVAVPVVLTINPEPVVDPTLGLKTICSGEATNITLNTNGISVAATTYAVTLVSQDAGLTGTPTTGASLAASAIASDKFFNVGAIPLKVKYQVIPKSAGNCVGQPFTIEVTVTPEPVINNALDNAVCSKDIAGIILSTNGTSVGANSYHLISVVVPGSITANAANATANSTGGINLIRNDKFTNTTSAAVIVTYTITGISPQNCEGQPQIIKLTINPEPTLAPGTANLCSDIPSGIVLGPAAGSPAITQYILKNIVKAPALVAGSSNAGLGTYTANNFLAGDQFTNTTTGPLQVTYTLNAVAAGCVGVDQFVVFTVNPAPAVAANLDRTVCTNDISGIVFASETSPLSAPASSYNILGVTITAGLTQTAGNSGARLAVTANEIQNDRFSNPGNNPLTVVYHIKAVSGSTCLGPQKDITLTVEPTIKVAPVNNRPDICSNDLTDIDLISPTNATSGPITFNYTASSSVGGLITGFIPAVSNLPANSKIADNLVNNSSSPATVTYVITAVANGAKSGAGCFGLPVPVSVIVEPKPKMTASPLVQTICEGVPASVILSSTTVPTTGTVQFTVDNVAVTGSMTLTSPAVAKTIYLNGESIVDVWSNPDTIQHTVTYTLKPIISGGLGCIGDVVTVTLNVNPVPNVVASVQAPICSNDFVNITLTSDVAGTINKWTAAVTAGTVTGAAGGSGDLIFQTLKNTGSIPANVRYTVTPKASGCAGAPINIDVIVNPIPTITGVPANQTVCYGATLTQNLTSPVAGVTFDWTVDPFPNSMGVPQTGSGPVISQVLSNPTGSQDFLTYTITATGPGATACQSQPKIFTVIAAPQMNVSILNPDTWLCKGNKDFLQIQLDGQAPFEFTWSKNDTLQPVLTKVGNFKSIPIQPQVTTVYKIVSMKDAFGCVYAGPFPAVVFTVGSTDASFSVVGPSASCSPFQVALKYDQKNGTEYTWRWGDGSPDSVYIASTDAAATIIHHTYTNTSPTQTLKPKIVLQTALPAPFPGCFNSTTQTLNIYPTIITNVYPDKSEICSGEEVVFTNQSFGVPTTGHRWFYREQGTTQEQDIRTTQSVNYVLTNSSAANPLIIEVVYQATNGNCPAPDVVTPIKVYRSAVPNFDFGGTLPAVHHYLVGGVAPVTFTNTSVPVDPAFKYEWDFGLDAHPGDTTGLGPFNVTYTSQGLKTVTLTVTNIIAPSCTNTITQVLTIELLPLVAEFKAEPKEVCFPGRITVTENTSTGDIMQWKLYDNNGSLVSVSTDNKPIFYITNPGTYTLNLRTSDSQTGLFKDAVPQKFTVYDKPFAAFQVLPPVVFVPNTELTTINNSAGATGYLWNFDDQNKTSTEIAPKYTYTIEGHYTITLIAQNDHGNGIVCTDTAKQVILAKQGGVSKIPNAFTPNLTGPTGGQSASGSNYDVFLPSIKGVEEYNLQIYDRWGNLLFESNSINVGWDGYKDGKLLPAGVYVYKITLRLSDGQRTTQIGDVTMIR